MSLAIAGVIITSWVLSYFRLDALEYKHGTLIPATAQSPWRFVARSAQASQYRGILRLTISEYTSYAAVRGELANWDQWRGWSRYSLSPSSIRTQDEALSTHWYSWSDFSILGFGAHAGARQGTTALSMTIPHWMLLGLPLAYLGTRSLAAWRARNRRHLCPHCGYDLRATPSDAPCPECGKTAQLAATV